MVLSTKDNGFAPIGMDMAFSTGLMEPSIKVYGKKIKPVEKESLLMPIVILMRDNGKMTRPTVSESTFMLDLKPNMKATGKTI